MNSSTEYILGLAKSFPCLGRKLETYNPREFDPFEFQKISRGWASGERQAALFVLMVWSGSNWSGKGCAFDVSSAVATLDAPDLEIVIGWMRKPVWP